MGKKFKLILPFFCNWEESRDRTKKQVLFLFVLSFLAAKKNIIQKMQENNETENTPNQVIFNPFSCKETTNPRDLGKVALKAQNFLQ